MEHNWSHFWLLLIFTEHQKRKRFNINPHLLLTILSSLFWEILHYLLGPEEEWQTSQRQQYTYWLYFSTPIFKQASKKNLKQCNHSDVWRIAILLANYCNNIRHTCRKCNTAGKFLQWQWKHIFLATAFSTRFIITTAGHNVDTNTLYFSFGLTIFSHLLLLSPINWGRPWNHKIPERKTYLWKNGEERTPGPLWQNKSHGLSNMQIWQG